MTASSDVLMFTSSNQNLDGSLRPLGQLTTVGAQDLVQHLEKAQELRKGGGDAMGGGGVPPGQQSLGLAAEVLRFIVHIPRKVH